MSLHFAWRLLYNKFPWLFDFVAGRASQGRWKEWGRSSIHYLEGGRVLELGHGPGHLLMLLKEAGCQPTGIDLSPGMCRQAARRLRGGGFNVPLVRCRSQILPFQSGSFDEVVATFPTDDILESNTLREIARLIPRGGRVVMVVGAQTKGSRPDPHFVDWMGRLIGQGEDPSSRKESVFYQAGLRARLEYHSVKENPVILVIAENRPGRYGWVNGVPKANAGNDIRILSRELATRVLVGAAVDPDGDPLTYRWIHDQQALHDWSPVGADGKALLNLGIVPLLHAGEHTLVLEVSDSYETAKDQVTLTIGNSPPNIISTGGGKFEVNTPVTLEARVADYDGDVLSFSWMNGPNVLAGGTVQTPPTGRPVDLPRVEVRDLSLGCHPLMLRVNDGANPSVSAKADVVIQDTIPPQLNPVPDKTLLWPPDHSMVPVAIQTHARDNSGMPVRLSATVQSSEPEEGLGDGDIGPDWRIAGIDERRGVITLRLRAERYGKEYGRQYTVAITATDQAGNASTAHIMIRVPHDLVNNN